MSISTEINLPVLSRSFVNRLLTEATKRREFAEESIHAIPELGMLFRKADTTASKFITSLSQDILSEFVTVVANEIINAFEEVVVEEAGGLENLSRSVLEPLLLEKISLMKYVIPDCKSKHVNRITIIYYD